MVGSSGSNNSLTIQSGGRVFSDAGVVGGDGELGYNDSPSTGSFSSVTVTGAGSLWSNNASLYVGYFGHSNSLTIANGGQVYSTTAYIGATAGAKSNAVLVTGSGSLWNNSGDLYVGGTGLFNQLTISNGGKVLSSNGTIGLFSSGGNSVLVTGAGSVWSNSNNLTIGSMFSVNNSMTISNGGQVFDVDGSIGSAHGRHQQCVGHRRRFSVV